jgi:hypothetical protein
VRDGFAVECDAELAALNERATPSVLDRAAKLANAHNLRAYDAVQLAAALELERLGKREPWWCRSDQELNAAAALESLSVDDPLRHP